MLRPRLTDRTALLTLLGLCVLLKVVVLAQQPITARDGIHYIGFAHDLCLTSPDLSLRHASFPNYAGHTRADVFKKHPYHPGYPLIIASFAKAYQAWCHENLTPTEWQWCAHLASSLAGVLLVIPLFSLARCFVPTRTASVGTALFIVLPAVVQITTDTLAESWLLLFTLSTLWCSVRAVREPQVAWFALAGLLAGCAYLVRLEALIVPVGAALALVTQRWWTGMAMPWRPALRGAIVLGVSFCYVIAPYVLVLGKMSNRPSVNQVVQIAIDLVRGEAGEANVCFAKRRQDGVNGQRVDVVQLGEAAALVVAAHGRAGHYFLWALAAVGLGSFWRARRDPAVGLLGSVALVHLAALLRLAYSAGYTSERHTLLLVSLAALVAAVGLVRTWAYLTQRLGRFPWISVAVRGVGVCLLAVLCLPKAVQPLHAGQEGHRQAGLWLGTHRSYANTLQDPYLWASFYAGELTPGDLVPRRMSLLWTDKDRNDLREEEIEGRINNPIPYHPVVSKRMLGIVDPRDNDLNRNRAWQEAGVVGPGSIVIWAWPSAAAPKLVIRQAGRE